MVEVCLAQTDDGSWRSVIHRGLDARLRLDVMSVEIGLDEVVTRSPLAQACPGGGTTAAARSD